MASPKLQEFCIVDASTGVEVIGATLGRQEFIFRTIKDETGANLSMAYHHRKRWRLVWLLPVFTTGHCNPIFNPVGSAYVPSVVSNFLRPEDYAANY